MPTAQDSGKKLFDVIIVRKSDVRQKVHRKVLIDIFINAIYLYDDRVVITCSCKEGTSAITFADLQDALKDGKTGLDLDCSGAPHSNNPTPFPIGDEFGLLLFFTRFKDTHFRNGVVRRP